MGLAGTLIKNAAKGGKELLEHGFKALTSETSKAAATKAGREVVEGAGKAGRFVAGAAGDAYGKAASGGYGKAVSKLVGGAKVAGVALGAGSVVSCLSGHGLEAPANVAKAVGNVATSGVSLLGDTTMAVSGVVEAFSRGDINGVVEHVANLVTEHPMAALGATALVLGPTSKLGLVATAGLAFMGARKLVENKAKTDAKQQIKAGIDPQGPEADGNALGLETPDAAFERSRLMSANDPRMESVATAALGESRHAMASEPVAAIEAQARSMPGASSDFAYDAYGA